MAKVRVSAERVLQAPADAVYRAIADYRQHHPRILPPAITDLRVERGGVGAGTAITFKVTLAGRTSQARAEVTEPRPGRVLVESGDGVTTTFTVEPVDGGTRVHFDTEMERPAARAWLERLLVPRLLRPQYEIELSNLERVARELAAANGAS
jgi:hypothetical protein